TSGSVSFAVRADDAYVQGDGSVALSIDKAEGGNYEAIDKTATTSTKVVDDSDSTKITLAANDQVTEGGQITVTASVANAPQGSDLVITLNNGQVITILAGAT